MDMFSTTGGLMMRLPFDELNDKVLGDNTSMKQGSFCIYCGLLSIVLGTEIR